MEPKEISKLISEDITFNNGLFEDIDGIRIDGDSKVDQFLKVIDREYIDLNVNDEKFKKVWAKHFPHDDIETAADEIRHSSHNKYSGELAAILDATIQHKPEPDFPGKLKNFDVTIEDVQTGQIKRYEIEAPFRVYAALQAISLSSTGDNIPWEQFKKLQSRYGKPEMKDVYPLVQALEHATHDDKIYKVFDEEVSFEDIQYIMGLNWDIILPLPQQKYYDV